MHPGAVLGISIQYWFQVGNIMKLVVSFTGKGQGLAGTWEMGFLVHRQGDLDYAQRMEFGWYTEGYLSCGLGQAVKWAGHSCLVVGQPLLSKYESSGAVNHRSLQVNEELSIAVRLGLSVTTLCCQVGWQDLFGCNLAGAINHWPALPCRRGRNCQFSSFFSYLCGTTIGNIITKMKICIS